MNTQRRRGPYDLGSTPPSVSFQHLALQIHIPSWTLTECQSLRNDHLAGRGAPLCILNLDTPGSHAYGRWINEIPAWDLDLQPRTETLSGVTLTGSQVSLPVPGKAWPALGDRLPAVHSPPSVPPPQSLGMLTSGNLAAVG